MSRRHNSEWHVKGEIEGGVWSGFAPGDSVGVLAKLGKQGYVKFFRNGKPFGWEHTGNDASPIKGPLVLAVQTCYKGTQVELQPYPAVPWLE